MIYRNSELRLDQIVTYLNDQKINLSPVFQRGHVWSLPVRQKLVKNIVLGKPIPCDYREPRPGDVRRHRADITLLEKLTGFKPRVSLNEGLARTVEFYRRRAGKSLTEVH